MKFRVHNSLKYEKEVNKSDAQAFSYASADSHHTRNTINFPSFTLVGAGSDLFYLKTHLWRLFVYDGRSFILKSLHQ